MKVLRGTVTSAKMTGTVTVATDRHIFHPIYKKRYLRTKKYHADTNGHKLGEGDVVEMTECRPLSKTKRFKVTQLISKGLQPVFHDEAEQAAAKKSSTPAQ